MAEATFEDPAIFKPIDMPPHQAETFVRTSLPKGLKSKGPWAFREKKAVYLPRAFMLPKRKKCLQKARPLIPATRHWLRKLHTAVARVITDLAKETYAGATLEAPTARQAVKVIHQFCESARQRGLADLVVLNRDLAGFFTAIPQADILRAAEELIKKHAKPFATTWFTTAIGRKKEPLRKGKHFFTGAVRMSAENVMQVIEHSFQAALFQVGQRVYAQTRGSMIGFVLSGPLSVITIMRAEQRNIPERRLPMSQRQWAAVRYADNLITLSAGPTAKTALPEWMLGSGQYGATVTLEFEGDLRYLGLELGPRGPIFHIGLLVPGYSELDSGGLYHERWRYRTPFAAASCKPNIAGIVTRLHSRWQ